MRYEIICIYLISTGSTVEGDTIQGFYSPSLLLLLKDPVSVAFIVDPGFIRPETYTRIVCLRLHKGDLNLIKNVCRRGL